MKTKAPAIRTSHPSGGAPKKPRIFGISFANVYPLYVQKAEKKGRTKAEVDEIIAWLTGYRGDVLQQALDKKVDVESFFGGAPRMNPNAGLITGVVCGVRYDLLERVAPSALHTLNRAVAVAESRGATWGSRWSTASLPRRGSWVRTSGPRSSRTCIDGRATPTSPPGTARRHSSRRPRTPFERPWRAASRSERAAASGHPPPRGAPLEPGGRNDRKCEPQQRAYKSIRTGGGAKRPT